MTWKSRYASWLVCPREGCTEPERIESREPIPGGTRYHCVCECGGRWAVVVLGERTTFATASELSEGAQVARPRGGGRAMSHWVVKVRREGSSPAYARRQVECACGRIVRSRPHDGRHAVDDAMDDCLAQLREAGCSIAPDGAAVTRGEVQ